MKTLECRNITFNNHDTKICISITGRTNEEITKQAKEIEKRKPDIVEWRADYYQTGNEEKDATSIINGLEEIHKILKEIPIIFTFRNKEEGGERQVDFATYKSYCSHVAAVAEKNNVALIDLEAYGKKDAEEMSELIHYIHECNVKIIGSNHHFDKTPSEEEMFEILSGMEAMGVDVCKLAVMPEEKEDVQALMEVSKKADEILKAPVITMSMGELGAVTRVGTRLTGSVLTFAAGENASAPGQLDSTVVRELLEIGRGCALDCNIALIGFMGTGKTTISKALSRITGFDEIDVDHYIVEKAGMEISEIFEKYGEAHFRDLETQALEEIQKGKGKIISCGGGAVLKDENVSILKQNGVIVLLTATPETIFERVKDNTSRPILNNDMSIEHVKKLMGDREPRYQSVADIKVNVDSNDRVLTCHDMLKKLKESGHLTVK